MSQHEKPIWKNHLPASCVMGSARIYLVISSLLTDGTTSQFKPQVNRQFEMETTRSSGPLCQIGRWGRRLRSDRKPDKIPHVHRSFFAAQDISSLDKLQRVLLVRKNPPPTPRLLCFSFCSCMEMLVPLHCQPSACHVLRCGWMG